MEELRLKNRIEIFEKKYLKQIEGWRITSFEKDFIESPNVKDLVNYSVYTITFRSIRGEVFNVALDKELVDVLTDEDFETLLLARLKDAIVNSYIQEM